MTNIIKTERLILRPLTLADADAAYYGWTGDPEVAKYVSWLPHHSINETIEWLKEVKWEQDDTGNIIPNNNYIWGFVLKETSELFGSGGLIWEKNWQLFQVGYNIKKTHWNHGYTTEAMRSILKFAAEKIGIKKVAGATRERISHLLKCLRNWALFMTETTLHPMLMQCHELKKIMVVDCGLVCSSS